jgi:Protein of unknown function (DUF4242)
MVQLVERGEMQTYLVIRRTAWPSAHEQRAADARSAEEATRMKEEIASIRSYLLEERDRTIGSVCIYVASSPEAVRRHASAADLPIDEIVRVADAGIARADPPKSATTPKEGYQ